MYLSKIEIIGFKSFAQRINLQFDSGVTAIVGPNGCGKTNIVDAIRWALGEQRYSTLRSDKMEDVIFNGTKNRKALGLAEVSLTIENTKGILPTEYSEVTITRRVFRSGESEYLLNKVPCRLKDIIDLFMDTGMGSDAYSVIELKMVETILSDKTDERRKLFEEAAGVTKYKHRRKAAIRKLEDVRQDLARVNDIVKEVQKTVNSLERQSKKAEQYNEVSTRLKLLEIDLLEREYAYLHAKLVPLEEKFVLASTDKSKIDSELRLQEESVDQLREKLQEIETELAEVQRNAAAQFELIHHAEEKILVANERRNSLSSNIDRYEQERTDLFQQEEILAQEKILLQQRHEELQHQLQTTEQSYTQAREEQHVAGSQLDAKKIEVQQFKDAILKLAHEIVQKQGEQERLKARIDNSLGRIDRSGEDNVLYESDVRQNEQRIAELTAQDRDLRRRFAEAEIELYNRETARKEIQQEIERLQKGEMEVSNNIERRNAKIEFLRRMIESSEGFSDGAKFLLNQESWKKRKLTTVADIVQTDPRYRTAIETALGDAAHLVIVDTVEEGYAAVQELANQQKGKATFICLQWVPKIRRHRKKNKTSPEVWASDVVRCEERYRPLISFLLDDAVFVDSLVAAKEVVAHHIGIRCITSDGQSVSSGGIVRGGSHHHDESGLIGKKSQIEELEKEIAELGIERVRLKDLRREKEKAFESHDLKQYAGTVKSIEKEMTSIEMRIAQLEFEKKRANDGIERNRTEIGLLQHEIDDQRKVFEHAGAELAIQQEHKVAQEFLAGGAMRELEQCEVRWSEKTKTVNDFEMQLLTVRGDLRNNELDVERTLSRVNDIQVTLVRREEEILRSREEMVRLAAETQLLESELVGLRSVYTLIEARKKEIEQAYGEKRDEMHRIELKMKDERRLHDESVTHTHELEMKIAELKSNIDHLISRAKEEFELELSLKTYPEDEWVDFAKLRDEVKNLKERIRILGAINFAAFDEFTTESERLTFLTQQRDDLIEAEQTLLNTIEEINTTAQRIFLETFGKIRENFITTFKELFLEGDECDLRLEENVDPLEANIEIIAKPRGKRPTSIDLLSGGEKTLTAIALLFAIYLVKPSPFCILDEVDAPLDDSNIDRYSRILKKFSGNTQFIVVTHNKRTMEAAQALYGVTMEEQGVSKIVTVRFNEEARVKSATVTN